MLKSFTPDTKNDSKESRAKTFVKALDKIVDFHASKVCGVMYCDSCTDRRCFCSDNYIGSKGSPTKKSLVDLERLLENGCFFGMKIGREGYFSRCALRCGDYVESQFYMSSIGKKGGHIETKDVYSIRFADSHVVSADEISVKNNFKGKNPLPVCQLCFV